MGFAAHSCQKVLDPSSLKNRGSQPDHPSHFPVIYPLLIHHETEYCQTMHATCTRVF
jgi:hypothetical protein